LSTFRVDSTSAVDINYGFQQSAVNNGLAVNYNNDYQVRQPVTQPVITFMTGSTVGPYEDAYTGFEPVPVNGEVSGSGNLSGSADTGYY